MKTIPKFVHSIMGWFFGLTLFFGTLYLLFYFSDQMLEKERPKITKVKYEKPNQWVEKYDEFHRSPHSFTKVKASFGKEVLYDVTYETDEYLLRVPINHDPKASYHAAFGGCSFTWGEGLNVQGTLPWKFHEHNPKFNSYNLGFPGGAVHTLLRYTEFFNLNEVFKEKKGLYVYVFTFFHMDRYLGLPSYLSWASDNFPFYDLEKGKPVYKGQLKNQKFFQDFKNASKLGVENSAIKMANIFSMDDKTIEKFALGVVELSDRYKKQFPKGEFVFLAYPVNPEPSQEEKKLYKVLEKRGIKVWDPRPEMNAWLKNSKKTLDDLRIPHDLHPNELANTFVSDWMSKKIKEDFAF